MSHEGLSSTTMTHILTTPTYSHRPNEPPVASQPRTQYTRNLDLMEFYNSTKPLLIRRPSTAPCGTPGCIHSMTRHRRENANPPITRTNGCPALPVRILCAKHLRRQRTDQPMTTTALEHIFFLYNTLYTPHNMTLYSKSCQQGGYWWPGAYLPGWEPCR